MSSAKLIGLRATYGDLCEEVEELLKSRKYLQVQIDEAEKYVKTEKGHVLALKESISSKESILKMIADEISRLETKQKKLEASNEEKRAFIKVFWDVEEPLFHHLGSKKTEMEETLERYKQKESTLKQLKSRLEALSGHRERYGLACHLRRPAQESHIVLTQKLEQLIEPIPRARLSRELSPRIACSYKIVEDPERTQTIKYQYNPKLSAEENALERDIAYKKVQKADTQRELRDMRAKLNALQTSLEQHKRQRASLEARALELQNQLSSLEKQKQKTMEIVAELRKEATKLMPEVEKAKAERIKLQVIYGGNLESLQRSVSELDKKLRVTRASLKQLYLECENKYHKYSTCGVMPHLQEDWRLANTLRKKVRGKYERRFILMTLGVCVEGKEYRKKKHHKDGNNNAETKNHLPLLNMDLLRLIFSYIHPVELFIEKDAGEQRSNAGTDGGAVESRGESKCNIEDQRQRVLAHLADAPREQVSLFYRLYETLISEK